MAETILGISPGTRSIGIAVFREGRLIEWSVKTFKTKWTKEKQQHMMHVIDRLIFYYTVSVLVLKKTDPLRSSAPLDVFVDGVVQEAKKKRIKLKQYSLYDLWFFCEGTGRNRKQGIADYVLETYPHLKQEYLKERNSNRPYYSKMFEAIVAGAMVVQEQKE